MGISIDTLSPVCFVVVLFSPECLLGAWHSAELWAGGCSSEGQALGTGRRDLPRDPYNSVSDEAGPLVVDGKASGVSQR